MGNLRDCSTNTGRDRSGTDFVVFLEVGKEDRNEQRTIEQGD